MYQNLLAVLTLFLTSVSVSALQALNDSFLAETYGQAIFEITEPVVKQPNGPDLNMVKLTIGARVEINANIEEVALGRYWRPSGTNCSGGDGNDKVCYNDIVPESYNDNINWACTANPCGSVGLASSNYLSSLLTHDVGEKEFSDKGIFPSGFEPDGGVDVKIRHLTMGQVNCDGSGNNCKMTPFVQENPYLEFAFDETGDTRKLVGFRLGSEDSFGYQGNAIDVISGFIRPNITAVAKINGSGNLGSIKLETQLGGVRTIGWIDANTTFLKSTSGLTGLLIGSETDLQGQSPHAQLFPVQSNYLAHTSAFFFSLGTRAINWSEIGGVSPGTTMPGFWINMGGDARLLAETQKGSHPINYYPGHSYGNDYYTAPAGAKIQNYDAPQASWSETYTP